MDRPYDYSYEARANRIEADVQKMQDRVDLLGRTVLGILVALALTLGILALHIATA